MYERVNKIKLWKRVLSKKSLFAVVVVFSYILFG